MKLLVQLINPLATDEHIPTKGSEYAAGWDVKACTSKPVIIHPGDTELIGTGVALATDCTTPHVLKLYGRSSLGHKFSIVLGNTVGIIDEDYRGEVMVSLRNQGTEPYRVMPGDRIAQVIPEWLPETSVVVQDVLSATDRGSGGFGSTGK